MIKAIIFDFDGVLVESVDIKTKAFASLFKKEKDNTVKKIVSYHLRHSGISRFEKFRHIYQKILKRGLSKEPFGNLCRAFSKLVVDEVVQAPFVLGAKEFLANNFRKYRCFLLSATPKKEIDNIAKKKKILHYFISIFGSPIDKVTVVKEIINKNNLKPNEAIYIGDSLSDYEAAVLNSVNFIARIYADNKEIFKSKDCMKIKNLLHLENIIRKFKDAKR